MPASQSSKSISRVPCLGSAICDLQFELREALCFTGIVAEHRVIPSGTVLFVLLVAVSLAPSLLAGGRALAPRPTLNAPPQAEVALGRVLFHETRLSGDAARSCATCHMPDRAFTDGLAISGAYSGGPYFRRTPSLLNVVYRKHLYWDGRLSGSDLPTAVRDHLSSPLFMAADGRLLVERLRQVPYYRGAFQDVYGGPPSYNGILRAVAAFLKTLYSVDAPLERFLRGEVHAMSPDAVAGLELFRGKAGCIRCHDGPELSDGRFHDLGLSESLDIPQQPLIHITFRSFLKSFGVPAYRSLRRDPGRLVVTKREEDRGRFSTPSLWDVDGRAPYMHNGRLATLAAVIGFYDGGGGSGSRKDPSLRRLGLTKKEKKQLLAFLEALSGKVPNEPATVAFAGPYDLFPPMDHPSLGTTTGRTGEVRSVKGEDAPEQGERKLEPLGPVPVPRDTPLTPGRIELGRTLFFDKRFSATHTISCATCHLPERGLGDGRAFSKGYPGTEHWRNSQTLMNTGYWPTLFWAGEVNSLEEQAHAAIVGAIAGNGAPEVIEERLAQVPEYVEMFRQSFGTTWPRYRDALRAIASFERTLVQTDTPVDRYLRGDQDALPPDARRGRELFVGKAGCIRCHHGPMASDGAYHNLGVPPNPARQRDPLLQISTRFQFAARGAPQEVYSRASVDPGLYLTTHRPGDWGRFRTPTLRYLAHSAPYMHNGVFESLEEVVDFFDRGGGDDPGKDPELQPLGLSSKEKADLVAFLMAFSGPEVLIPYAEELVYKPQPGFDLLAR